jgi:hypothetical protein
MAGQDLNGLVVYRQMNHCSKNLKPQINGTEKYREVANLSSGFA